QLALLIERNVGYGLPAIADRAEHEAAGNVFDLAGWHRARRAVGPGFDAVDAKPDALDCGLAADRDRRAQKAQGDRAVPAGAWPRSMFAQELDVAARRAVGERAVEPRRADRVEVDRVRIDLQLGTLKLGQLDELGRRERRLRRPSA